MTNLQLVDNVTAWVVANHRSIVLSVGAIYVTLKVGSKIKEHLAHYKHQQMLKKWTNSPKDVVILHTIPYGATVPHISPFVLKLETYLRMNNIPYEMDFEIPWGPLGKIPWITLNGQHIADSQLIVEFLRNKCKITNGNYTEEKRAIATTVRIMVDEYLFWGLVLWRYIYSDGKGLDEIMKMPSWAQNSFFLAANRLIKNNAWAQGTGRHSPEQVTSMMKDGLKSLSIILGNKKFLLGDEPCEEDCAVFGGVANLLWAAPGSPYEKYIKEELVNLHDYCNRIKSLYWNDWDNCLTKNPEDGYFSF